MADDRWEEQFRSWAYPSSFVHPDSPAGGSGTGASRAPGPEKYAWPSSSSLPHPDSPAGRHFSWHIGLPHLLVEQRARAVYQALVSAPKYVPRALYNATGQELSATLSGIIPGLLMFIGVLAASTALGAAAGAAIGALAFGAGAIPGAAIGGELGFDAGVALLGYLGLGFLVVYIGRSLLEAATVAGEAVLIAWRSVDNRRMQRFAIDEAAHRLALAVGLVFRGVLQGIVAFLLAKGSAAAASRVPELVSKLRASKLGTGFAEWVERNWKGLVENPRLQNEQRPKVSGGSGSAAEQLPKSSPAQTGTKPAVTPAPGKPGSPEHKAQRWAEYQARTAPDKRWPYDRWSKTYDQNMTRAIEANKAVDAYHKEIGGWGEREVTLDVEGVPRRLDIADESTLRGVEYKTGEQYLTEDNAWEITRDEILVKETGWHIDWVFEQPPSGPLRSALESAGVNVIVR